MPHSTTRSPSSAWLKTLRKLGDEQQVAVLTARATAQAPSTTRAPPPICWMSCGRRARNGKLGFWWIGYPAGACLISSVNNLSMRHGTGSLNTWEPPFCAGMAASVRFVGVAQNAIFCGVGTAWRTRSEVQQDGTVMHDRGEYDSGLRDCRLAGYVRAEHCLVSARTPWSRHPRLLGPRSAQL